MKKITIISLLALTLLNAGELEKEIKYLGNDGVKESHEIVCINGNSAIITIDNNTKEISIGTNNIGKTSINIAVKKICR